MATIGKVDSLWRYPVKSMAGEALDEAFLGFAGVYGDRLFAFTSSAGPKGFPFLTAREQHEMRQREIKLDGRKILASGQLRRPRLAEPQVEQPAVARVVEPAAERRQGGGDVARAIRGLNRLLEILDVPDGQPPP